MSPFKVKYRLADRLTLTEGSSFLDATRLAFHAVDQGLVSRGCGRKQSMYENAFNSIERDLRAEDGIANELDYVEQISWVLFLKYLHDLESERRDRAELDGEDYTPIIDGDFRWDL